MCSIYINNIAGPNKTINALGSQIVVIFSPPIVLDSNKKYEMALLNGSVVYANPNVTNRYLRFTYKGDSYDMLLENGIYDIDALNVAFQNLTSYLYPTNGLFSIEALTSTSQVCIFFYDYANTQLNFQSNGDNIMDLLGFTPVTTANYFVPQSITSYAISQGKAMLNNISQFIINVDCINSSYNNSQGSSSLLFTSTIEVSPYSTQNLLPYNLCWCNMFKTTLSSITVTITSDNGTLVDMTGGNTTVPELFAVTLLIKEKK